MLLFALGGDGTYSPRAEQKRCWESIASIRSRHRSCRTSKETARNKNAASEKCQNDIGSRNRMRGRRGRKSNARREERLLLEKTLIQMSDRLFLVCEQHWAIILIGGEESSTSSDRWPSGFIAQPINCYTLAAHSISLPGLPAWLSANRRHTPKCKCARLPNGRHWISERDNFEPQFECRNTFARV
jgi:hypothetical protein